VIKQEDRVPLWHLARNTGMRKRELVPILETIGLTLDMDPVTGDVYLDRQEFGDLLRSVAEGAV
jgi:hypothetical protein